MSEINKQIEEMAEKMEKSATDPKENLFAVIKSLGPKGLKEKLATLSEDDKVVLKAALEELTLKKAVEFDDAYAAKMIQGKVRDTIIQEDIASDDADEKLVKPSAAKMAHQGTPTDGWSGQVIKSIEESDEQMDELIEKAMAKCSDDKMVMKKLKEKGMDEKKVQGAVDRYNSKKAPAPMEKAMSKDAAKDKLMEMEEKEHGTKNPKKLVQKEKEEQDGKKEMMASMKKSDEEIEKAKKMNKEEDQLGDAPEMNEKTMGKKSPAPNVEDVPKASKDAQKNVNKMNVKKAVFAGENDLLKANTGGRNFHFNVEEFITETLKTDVTAPELKKSEKEDVNDIIAKSEDRNWDQVNEQRKADANKTNGSLVKSFSDEEFAEVMGLSVEEAKKILG